MGGETKLSIPYIKNRDQEFEELNTSHTSDSPVII